MNFREIKNIDLKIVFSALVEKSLSLIDLIAVHSYAPESHPAFGTS